MSPAYGYASPDTPGEGMGSTANEGQHMTGHENSGQDVEHGFHSSLPAEISSRVASLTQQYQTITGESANVPSMLTAFIRGLKSVDILYDALTQYVSVLKGRPSQVAASGHVSVYDETLLALMDESKGHLTPGAILLFLERIMGLNVRELAQENGCGDREKGVTGILEGYSLLRQLTPRAQTVQSGQASVEPHANDALPTPASQARNRRDPLPQILQTYNMAKAEFFRLFAGPSGSPAPMSYDLNQNESELDSRQLQKLADAAKFLRDTAENTLTYMRSCAMHISHPMVPELEANFLMAREKVVELSGGRKRRFEIDDRAPRLAARNAYPSLLARSRMLAGITATGDGDRRFGTAEHVLTPHAHPTRGVAPNQSAMRETFRSEQLRRMLPDRYRPH